jgi:hypothetical protein
MGKGYKWNARGVLLQFQLPFAGVILRREAPKDLASADSANARVSTTGEILRGCAAQDDICQEYLKL